MRYLTHCSISLLLAIGLAGLSAGCSAKARKASHLARADKYFDSGQYPQAEIEYRNVLTLDRVNAHAIARLGLLYYEEGRMAMCYPYIMRALELNPNDMNIRVKAGLLYLATGDPAHAREQALAVLEHSPTNAEAPFLLVESAATKQDVEDIKQRLEGLRQQAGETATIEAALGTLYYRTGDTNSGDAALKKALALDAKSIPALSALGTLYWARNDLTNADKDLKAAAELSPLRSTRRLRYADFKLRTGDADTAKGILSNITKNAADYLPAWTSLAEIAFAQRQFTNSASYVKEALARDPNDYNGLMLSARLKLAQRDTDKAITELERLSTLFNRSPQVFYQLAVAYLMKDDVTTAFKNVNQAIALNPDYADAILLQAQLNMRRDNTEAAIAALNRLVSRQPRLPQAYLLLVSAYAGRGDYENALANCRKLSALAPKNPQVPLLTGTVYLQQKNIEEARKQFEAAVAMAPEFVPAFEQLVNLDLSQKLYESALKRVQAKQEEFPKSPIVQMLLAKVYAAQTNTDMAEQALLKAIDLEPTYEPAYLMLANLYVSTKENAKALEKLNQTLAKNPRDVSALMLSGMIQNEQQDYAAARDAYEKLLAINPRFSPALNNLAYLYSEKLGQLDKAYEAARKAREVSPDDPYSGDTLGWILFKRKEYSYALNLLQASAEQLSREPEVQFHLGMAYYMMNDEARAKTALSRSLSLAQELNKDFSGKTNAEQRLAMLNIDPKTAGADVQTQLEQRIAEQPDDIIALVKLGGIYQRQGAAEKAARTYESALQQNPKNARLMGQLAGIYSSQLHDSQRALDLAKDAYKLAPDDPEISYALGRLIFATGDFKWALSLLQQTAQKQPQNPDVLCDLAYAYYSVGRVADAQDAMQSALKAEPAFARAADAKEFLTLLASSATPAKAAEAEPRAKEILRAAPTNAPALMIVAGAAEQRGDAPAASTSYEQVLKRYPDFLPAIRRVVVLNAETSGNDQRMYDLATKARQAFPGDPEVAKALGIISYNRADYRGAARLLNESTQNRTLGDAKSFYYLGMAQFQLKDLRQSTNALQKALSLDLPSNLAEKARETLASAK